MDEVFDILFNWSSVLGHSGTVKNDLLNDDINSKYEMKYTDIGFIVNIKR